MIFRVERETNAKNGEFMGIEQLKQILKMKGADPASYDLDLEGDINCQNGLAIKKVVVGYFFSEIINGKRYFNEHLGSLDTACDHLCKRHCEGGNPYYWDDERRRHRIEEHEAPFVEADRRLRLELKEFAEQFEAKQKLEGRSSNMTFEELKYILIKENINPYSWCILGCACVSGYDGYVIKEAENGYDLYYMERGQYDFLEHADNEHKACLAFLNTLAESGDYSLIKYINFNELPESSLLTVKLPKYNPLGYDIQEAIKLSLKLGRKLTDEESKQFEIQK